MKIPSKLAFGIGVVAVVGGGGAYWFMSPTPWERDSLASIKAGDYEEAMKIAKRGLVEKPGHQGIQSIFLTALTLQRAQDGQGSWFHETVSEGVERYLADLNIVGPLSQAKEAWVDGETRQKSVDFAQDELREIRKGFASKGMSLDDVKDLKSIAKTAAKKFLDLKLDPDKHEVQRVTLTAYKTLLLLNDAKGVNGIVGACEKAKDLDRRERVAALKMLGAKNFDVLKKIALDKDHSLYKDARLAVVMSVWNSEEPRELLKNYEIAKMKAPTGNYSHYAVLDSVESAKNLRCQGEYRAIWYVDDQKLVGSGFGWCVPLLKKDGNRGIGVIGQMFEDKIQIAPVEKFVVLEDDIEKLLISNDPSEKDNKSPQRLAVLVAARVEQTTKYRDEYKFNPWTGGSMVKVPYQDVDKVPYWVVLQYNASSKRMEIQGYKKGINPFDKESPSVTSIPAKQSS